MSPDLGRFLQPDPIGFKGDASNLYRYCGNDWANRTDPMGLTDLGDFMAGVDDFAAFGIIEAVVGKMSPSYAASINRNSGWYRAGQAVGIVAGAADGESEIKGLAKLGGRAFKKDAAKDVSKVFSKEKDALVQMAKRDKQLARSNGGITTKDMQDYKNLNKELKDPFPDEKMRGPEWSEKHGDHGHVGPVNHIPIQDGPGPNAPKAEAPAEAHDVEPSKQQPSGDAVDKSGADPSMINKENGH